MIYQKLLSQYKMHVKARTAKHALYPARVVVPDDTISWQSPFESYYPTAYTAPVVLDVNTPWADPADIKKVRRRISSFEGEVRFNQIGWPLNPFGRTGLAGRGVLGKWGANEAVDAVITMQHPDTHRLCVLTITRRDTGELAFPGGMVDEGETPFDTRNRELFEEVAIDLTAWGTPLYEAIVSQGYVDDPRNTDNAWMETTAIHTHIAFDVSQKMHLIAGDDAVGAKWTEVTPQAIETFYANHGFTLLMAVQQMIQQSPSIIHDSAIHQFNKLFF